MNKKLMLVGLCLMGVFSSLHADDSEPVVNDTTTIVSDTTITTPSEENKEVQQTNEDCGCGKKKN